MDREEVSFFSQGLRLAAYFYPPRNSAETVPGIVFCTGFTGTKENREQFVRPLVEAGYAVLVADHRGWGRSEGEPGEIYPLGQVEDIRSALTYLQTRPEVQPDCLGLFGVSFGGANAMYAAGVDERVLAAVSVSGISDGGEWLHAMRPEWDWRAFLRGLAEDRRTRVLDGAGSRVDPTEAIMIAAPERRSRKGAGSGVTTPLACAEAIIQYRPADLVERISPRAAMWICVEGDPVVPAAHSRSMYSLAGPPRKIVELPGEAHYEAYEMYHEEIFEHTLAWFERYLQVRSAGRMRQEV